MEDSGAIGFQPSLDPAAREFVPVNPYGHLRMMAPGPFVLPPIFYSYPSPPYFSANEIPVIGGGVVGYPQWQLTAGPEAFFGLDPLPLPPLALPPPSATPSRTLLLTSVPTDVSESTVRRELEVFGDVRAVQMERVCDGLVTVHFYDLRDAQAAMMAVQEQHMQHQCRLRKHFEARSPHNSGYDFNNLRSPPLPPPAPGLISGRAVWAHSIVPVTTGFPDGRNQGTIVVFNLDPEIPSIRIKEIFQAFGPVRELRGTPLKRNQRFVEFYDVRHAAKALAETNGKQILGKQVVIEFSRPGGGGYGSKTTRFLKSAAAPNYPASKTMTKSAATTTTTTPQIPQPNLLSVRKSCSSKGGGSAASNNNCGNKIAAAHLRIIRDNNGGMEEPNNHISLRDVVVVVEERRSCKKGNNILSTTSKAAATTSTAKLHHEFKNGGSSSSSSSRQCNGTRQAKDFDVRFLIDGEAILDSNCRDSRTTVMIKNIPNKYSQKLLLNMLDSHCIHCNEQIADGDDQPLSSYDFIYLPIDFINRCNVGYGFVNMTSPQATWRLYRAFHRQNWEVFNSRKICEVTYARLQGLEALKEHFKNSKFPCESQEFMPVVFSPPRDGLLLTEPVAVVGRLGFIVPNNHRNSPVLASPADLRSLDEESELRPEPENNDGRINGGNFVDQNNKVKDINGNNLNDDDNNSDECGGVGGGRRSCPNGGDSGDEEDD